VTKAKRGGGEEEEAEREAAEDWGHRRNCNCRNCLTNRDVNARWAGKNKKKKEAQRKRSNHNNNAA